MPKKKKMSWVYKLKRNVKDFLTGEAEKEAAVAKVRAEHAAARLAAEKKVRGISTGKKVAKKKKSKSTSRATARTKQIESGSAKGDFKKMRGNY